MAQCQGWKLIAIKIRGANSYPWRYLLWQLSVEDGQSLDMQLVEEGDGKVVLNNPEKCGGTTLEAAMFYQRKVRPS